MDISQTTLQRIESGVSKDINTLKYMQILLKFPEVALWQLKQTGNQVRFLALAVINKILKTLNLLQQAEC